jgi:hypothetical protein
MLGLKNDPRCQELSGLADASAISLDAGRYRSYSQLNYLIACGHHQGGLTGLVQAAEPASVERRLAWLLLIHGIVLPDLHQIAAARARITVTRDDDTLLSISLSFAAQAPSQLRHHLP